MALHATPLLLYKHTCDEENSIASGEKKKNNHIMEDRRENGIVRKMLLAESRDERRGD